MENTKKFDIAAFLKQNLVLCGIIVLCLITAIVEPKFIGAANINNVMKQLSALPFMALGMTFVIIAGFIDLSVPGMIGLCSVVIVSLINPLGQVGAIIVGILFGAMLGYINGFTLTKCGALTQAEVLFITYGFSSIWIAIGLLLTNAETLRIERCVKSITIFKALGTKNFGVVPLVLVVFIIILICMHLFHTKTLLGRSIALLGGNKDAAFLCGFNTKRIMRIVYAMNGAFAAMAAIAIVSRVTTATAGNGADYETNSILCVVVGGTTLKGGKGSVLRTMLGVVLITLLGNCMNMLNLSTYMQTVMRGAVLVIAIWLDNRKEL